MARIRYIPNRVIDTNGISDGASIGVYQTGTLTPVEIYSNADFSTPLSNPFTVDAGAPVPEIFADYEPSELRVRVVSITSTVVSDDDPFDPTVNAADLAASTGGALVGFIQSGTGASLRTIESRLRDTVSVKDFGAVGDNSTDDTAAIQAAIDAVCVGGGELFFPPGTYLITTALSVDSTSGVTLKGVSNRSIIRQTGSGEDAVVFSTSTFLFNSGIVDLGIRCLSSSGHCLKIGYGISNCFFRNVNFIQTNPAKSVIYGDFTSGGGNVGGIFGSEFSGGIWNHAQTSTVPGVQILANGQVFNENVFRNIVLYYAVTVAFFDISTVTGLTGYWLENNYFCNLYFELCPGGLFKFDSANKWKFDGIRAWDIAGTYTNHLIEMAAGLAGTESKGNEISNFSRLGGSMDTGKYDIKVTAGQDTVYTSVGMETSTGPKFDFGSKRATVIGRIVGTLDNASLVTFFGGSSGSIKFPGSSVSLSTYDEGTWTATLSGTGSAPTTPVTVSGFWTRIGRKVSVSAKFDSVDTTGASGAVIVSGLPFTVNASTEPVNLAHMIGMGTFAAAAKATGTTITLYRQTSGTTIAHSDGTAGPGKSITISLEYIV